MVFIVLHSTKIEFTKYKRLISHKTYNTTINLLDHLGHKKVRTRLRNLAAVLLSTL